MHFLNLRNIAYTPQKDENLKLVSWHVNGDCIVL